MFRILRQWSGLAFHMRSFSRLAKLNKALVVRSVRAKGFEIDKDPDKDKLMKRLINRQKELDALENNFTCVGLKEMLDNYKKNEDGSITSCIPGNDGKPRTFSDLKSYNIFAKNKLRRYHENLKLRLTPMQLYVTQSYGFEKPFTGLHWSARSMGMYSCVICGQKIFRYTSS